MTIMRRKYIRLLLRLRLLPRNRKVKFDIARLLRKCERHAPNLAANVARHNPLFEHLINKP
jgi:hypothetical protein